LAIQVERLIATLEARMTKYDAAMKKVLGTTNTTFAKVETRGKMMEARLNKIGAFAGAGMTSFARGLAAPLAALLSLRLAVSETREALDKFGAIADDSAAAGIDAEFFQGLAYQASLGGVAIEALAGSLAAFAKNSGLAAEGKGRMVTALKALDPALLDNIRNSETQEDRIRLVVEALAKETDAAKRAAIATSAFGDSGTKLANVFAGGVTQLDAMAAKAKALGLVVANDLIAKADELGDEFDTVTQIVDLQLKQALVNLGPTLTYLIGLVGQWLGALNVVLDQFKTIEERTVINPLQNQLAELHNVRIPLGWEIDDLKAEIEALGVDNIGATGMNLDLQFKQAEFDKMLDMSLQLQNRIAELQGMGGGTFQLPAAPDDPEDTPDLPALDLGGGGASAAIDKADEIAALIANLKLEQDQLGRTADQQELYNLLNEAGVTLESDYGQAIEATLGPLQEKRRLTEENTKAQEQLAETMSQLGDVGVDALTSAVDALRDGKIEADEFNSILADVLISVLEIGKNLLLSSIVPGGGGGMPWMPREKGGPVRKGQPYIVGEKRPELFVPKEDGKIVPQVPRSAAEAKAVLQPAPDGTAAAPRRLLVPPGSAPPRTYRAAEQRQRGGPVQKGQPYIVGEKRRELYVPESFARERPPQPPTNRSSPVAAMPAPIFNIDARGALEGVAEQIETRLRTFARFEMPSQVKAIIRDPRKGA